MEATRGQSHEPQERPQRHKLMGVIHGLQDPDFVASVWQTLVRQGESRASKQGEGEPKKGRELLHASPELQDFSLEFRCHPVRHVHADDDRRCLAEPPPSRRARDAKIGGDGHVPGGMDEIPKTVIVALLKAARGRHADDHRSSADAAQPLEDIAGGPVDMSSADNSRRRVQNVRVDSSDQRIAFGHDSVCEVGADTLGTDTLKEGFVFESIAGPPLRTSMSPRIAVGALVVALLKMVTTIRFHGALS
jgi:hypothetical protein